MRAELERFRTERDQFKIMAETIQMRYSAIKNSLENSENDIGFEGSSSTLGFLLNQSREKNMALQTETETLRQKLSELQGDIKLLRDKNTEITKVVKAKASSSDSEMETARKAWNEEKSKLIDQLEGLKKANAQMKFDFRSLLDEKEEIVNERDVYKCKAHRLNHELNIALKGDGSVDIDALVLENKFQSERVDNLQRELEFFKKSNEKLQSMMKTKRVKGAVKFGTDHSKEMIMSHKQGESCKFIQRLMLNSILFLPSVTKLLTDSQNSELKAATTADLKALCLALLENLNDKSTALGHQKQTNRLLAAKIGTLEQSVRKLSGDSSKSSFTPSQLLLDNYASAKVDEDLRLPRLKEVFARNGESSDRSYKSSEYETQSTSDLSSELKQFNFIKIINNDEDEDVLSYYDGNEFSVNLELDDQPTVLPPDIQKLVDEAMRNSEKLETQPEAST